MEESAAELQRQVSAGSKARVVYQFEVPENLRTDEVTATVGLVKLNGREEQAAAKRAKGDSGSLAFELVKASLYEVDGRRLNKRQFEEEKVWNALDPKLRNLVLAAFAHLHAPEEDETENFIQTMGEKVG